MKKIQTKNIIKTLVVSAILITVFMIYKSTQKVTQVVEIKDVKRFTGKVENFDTGCFVDATCSITISGKKVILVTGGRSMGPAPVGSLLGVESIGDIDKKIGSEAEVYADKLSENEYSLYGDKDYYVKVK